MLTYLAAALALVVFVLPSALRPPAEQSNQSAELSPNAPHNHQQSIIAALQAASSGTQGSGFGPGNVGSTGGPGPGLGAAPGGPQLASRYCPYGIGGRQTFSLYSAPCAPSWSGDNGGATAPGVTATQVRIAVGYPAANVGTNGPVTEPPNSNQNKSDFTWSVVQQWLNSRYQFWGRSLQLYVVNDSESPTAESQVAATAYNTYHVFAAEEGRVTTMQDMAHYGIIDFAETLDQFSDAFLNAHAPYLWEWHGSTTQMMKLSAEFLCKKLANGNAVYAGDPTIQAKKRKFGLVYDGQNAGTGPTEQELRTFLAQDCGLQLADAIEFPYVEYNDSASAQDAATAVSKLRADGVTTVVDAADWLNSDYLTNSANSQGYFPEWYTSGEGLTDENGGLQNSAEWAHAFGISGIEIDGGDLSFNPQLSDGYIAFEQIAPGASQDNNILVNLFYELEQIANGIQEAGPHLTPATFEQGLFKIGVRQPVPVWSVGGGYYPDHHAYADDVGVIWWDTSADSGTGGYDGAWRWVHCGRRYGPGQMDSDTSQLFKAGITTRQQAADAGSGC